MKKLKILIVAVLIIPLFSSGKNPSDSLFKKVQMGIYENPDLSLKLARQLLKTEKNPDKIIEIYLLVSNVYLAKRNFDESLRYILKAKESLNRNTDANTRANVLISIAVQYQQMELFSKSLETLDEAEAFHSNLPKESSIRHSAIGKTYAIRGMIYKSQSNPEMALDKFLIAEKNLKYAKASVPNFANLSVILYNIGYCYIGMDRYRESKFYFLQSIENAKKADAKSLEAFALKGLAEMYMLNGQYPQSVKMLSQAENLSQNVGDLVLNEGIYKGLADNYLALNELENYKIFNKKYIEIRFQREQIELKSINRSIENQTEESNKKRQSVSARFNRINMAVIMTFSILLTGFIILILRNRKANNRFKKQIQELMLNK